MQIREDNIGLESMDDLAAALAARYFHGVHDAQLLPDLLQMLSLVRVERQVREGRGLRQALTIAHLNPIRRSGRPLWSGSRAIVRLQLSSGLLYGLHLKGNICRALQRLACIGDYLADHAYDPEAVKVPNQRLVEMVAEAGDEPCEIRISLVASVVPGAGMSARILGRLSLATLNALRQKYRLRPLNLLPADVAQYCASRVTMNSPELQAYVALLDQQAFSLVRHFESSYHHRYDDLRVYNFFAGNEGRHCRYRGQAMRELPWLLHILSGMNKPVVEDDAGSPAEGLADRESRNAVLDAIDSGRPLFAAVAAAYAVHQETIRWSRGKALRDAPQFETGRIRILLRVLSWLPPEKRPQCAQEWHCLRHALDGLLTILDPLWSRESAPDLLLSEPCFTSLLRHWLRELAAPGIARIERTLPAKLLEQEPGDLRDYLANLLAAAHRYCRRSSPAGEHSGDRHITALAARLSGSSLRDLARVTRRWHETLETVTAHDGRLHSADLFRWSPVLQQPLPVAGLIVAELANPGALAEEGRIMGHCVAGYVSRCMAGSSVILSLRDLAGMHLSTAELLIEIAPLRLVVAQHRGHSNREPPPRCEAALTVLMSMLNGGRYRGRLEERHDYQKANAARCRAAERAPRGFGRAAEAAAWESLFGYTPEENSCDLAEIAGASISCSGRDTLPTAGAYQRAQDEAPGPARPRAIAA